MERTKGDVSERQAEEKAEKTKKNHRSWKSWEERKSLTTLHTTESHISNSICLRLPRPTSDRTKNHYSLLGRLGK